jgi:hypothetical protein
MGDRSEFREKAPTGAWRQKADFTSQSFCLGKRFFRQALKLAIPISSSIIDGSELPQLLIRGEQTAKAVTGSGGPLHFGMVSDIKSERWPN